MRFSDSPIAAPSPHETISSPVNDGAVCTNQPRRSPIDQSSRDFEAIASEHALTRGTEDIALRDLPVRPPAVIIDEQGAAPAAEQHLRQASPLRAPTVVRAASRTTTDFIHSRWEAKDLRGLLHMPRGTAEQTPPPPLPRSAWNPEWVLGENTRLVTGALARKGLSRGDEA